MHYILLTLLLTLIAPGHAGHARFIQECQTFAAERQIDPGRIGSRDYLQTEFAFIEEFGTQQFPRRRPGIEGMDRDPRWTPYKENKVSLHNGSEMSASFIDLSSHPEQRYHNFIASQAPYTHNAHLFWQMIWEKKIDQIVMVTELREPKGELSAPYWPADEETVALPNSLKITLVDEQWLLPNLKENIQIRTFRLSRNGQERRVVHYWYHNWPDQSAPSQSKTILTLIERVKRDKAKSHSPILVHCHGGVGRSGVFIALYHMLQRKEVGDEQMSLFECVAYMRWQRPKMVSKPSQYEFCYDVLGIR